MKKMLRLSEEVWKSLMLYKLNNRAKYRSIDAILRDLIEKAKISTDGKIVAVDQKVVENGRKSKSNSNITNVTGIRYIKITEEVWKVLMRYKVNYMFKSIDDVIRDLIQRAEIEVK